MKPAKFLSAFGLSVITTIICTPIFAAEPQSAPHPSSTSRPVIRRSVEKFLSGGVFVSKTLHESGLGPTGPVPGHWRITFSKPGHAIFDYSDVRSGFQYHVLNNGTLRVWLGGPDREMTALFDAAKRELTLEGIVYAMEPQQAATRPATVPEHDPPLTQVEMDEIFKYASFSKERIVGSETPRIEVTSTRLHVFRGHGKWDAYYAKFHAPSTIIAKPFRSDARPEETVTAIYDADVRTLTWRGEVYRQHPWLE